VAAGVSRGKGQDLFLRSFHESLQIIKEKKLQVPRMHAVIVGSDMSKHTTIETELRSFASEKGIQDRVHFINKTLTVAPYLAAIDVLVQNSQVFTADGYVFCACCSPRADGNICKILSLKIFVVSFGIINFCYLTILSSCKLTIVLLY